MSQSSTTTENARTSPPEPERDRRRELLAQAPAAIGLMTGPEHRWTYVNEQLVRVTGRNGIADFVGATFRQSLPELVSQGFLRLLDEVYRTGIPYSAREMRVELNRPASGPVEERYFDFVYQPVRNEANQVDGILLQAVEVVVQPAMTRDITEGKRAEETLHSSQGEFRALADTLPQLVWMANPDGWLYWYNQRWYDYTGATPEQMEGWGWQSVHNPATLPLVLERWKASIATGEPFEMTFPLRGADGVFRPFLTRAVPVRNQHGIITRWIGTNTDVSAEAESRKLLQQNQEQLEAALVASQRLAAIVESSDDAIVSKDLNGVVTSWNRCAERLFGYSAEEMIGSPITKIIPPELQDDERRILAAIARGERIEHFETVRLAKGGEEIEVSLTISPVKDETGKIVGAAKIARDITQRNQTERALRTTEKLASVGRLAATMAHEINNPLEAVTNLIFLAKQGAVNEQVQHYLQMAEEELDRVSVLTRQTLGFYRETKGASRTNIASLIEPLLSVFSARARNRGITISQEIKPAPEIYAVPGEIRQLVANLLSNSIDAVNAGGHIRVRLSRAIEGNGRRRSGVRLTIADSGAGIPLPFRSKLFQPFFTTKKETGTGLGLWVCKSIVEKHQGSIRFKSSIVPGRSWTVFSVFLPEHSEVAERAS